MRLENSRTFSKALVINIMLLVGITNSVEFFMNNSFSSPKSIINLLGVILLVYIDTSFVRELKRIN